METWHLPIWPAYGGSGARWVATTIRHAMQDTVPLCVCMCVCMCVNYSNFACIAQRRQQSASADEKERESERGRVRQRQRDAAMQSKTKATITRRPNDTKCCFYKYGTHTCTQAYTHTNTLLQFTPYRSK